jgi:hypothetical protein
VIKPVYDFLQRIDVEEPLLWNWSDFVVPRQLKIPVPKSVQQC